MARVVKDRGANGHDSILFRQDLDYPRAPGQITYYPPEPSDELRKQVTRDKAGGIILYIIGFAITLIGYLALSQNYPPIDRYNLLIPLILILGLISAIMYLAMNNVALAKLSRALPRLLMLALVLLLLVSVIQQVMNLMITIQQVQSSSNPSFDVINNGLNSLLETIVNPGFFIMAAGLLVCIAGGTMLWTSTKVLNQYIPAMIIIENPAARVAESPAAAAYQAPPDAGEYAEEPQPDTEHTEHACQSCSQPMTYIPEYDRYYCYDCQTYGPAE